MTEIQKQIEWWKRQRCSNPACQFESEIPGFIHTVEKMLAVVEVAKMVHGMDDVKPGECAVCDALSALVLEVLTHD